MTPYYTRLVTKRLRRAGLLRYTKQACAEGLGCSTDTLERRLADEGTSWLALLEAERKRREAIADQLCVGADIKAELLGFWSRTSYYRWAGLE